MLARLLTALRVSACTEQRELHTTALLARDLGRSKEPLARRRARSRRLIAKREQSKLEHRQSAPDPVLGYRPGNEALWQQSELCGLILDRNVVWGLSGETEQSPRLFNFALQPDESTFLFEQLPEVSQQRHILRSGFTSDGQVGMSVQEAAAAEEEAKADHLRRVVDLRNASSAGIRAATYRRICEAFGRATDPSTSSDSEQKSLNSGLSEVQIAILTARIRAVLDHLKLNPKEQLGKRALSRLVQKRLRVCRYLRKEDASRYEICLSRCGIEPRAVQGSVVIR